MLYNIHKNICVSEWTLFSLATLASAGISCHRVSLRLSVRLSQVGVLLKRLNVRSRKQRRTIAQGLLVFSSDAKNLFETQRGHPNEGAKCRRVTLNAAEVAQN